MALANPAGRPLNGRGPMNLYAPNAKFSFFRGNIEPVFPNYPVDVAKQQLIILLWTFYYQKLIFYHVHVCN